MKYIVSVNLNPVTEREYSDYDSAVRYARCLVNAIGRENVFLQRVTNINF